MNVGLLVLETVRSSWFELLVFHVLGSLNRWSLIFLLICGQIVLTEQQREEKKAAEAELSFARSELVKEVDPTKSKALREEVNLMEKKLDELLASFEVCMKRSEEPFIIALVLDVNCQLLLCPCMFSEIVMRFLGQSWQ